MADLSAFVLGQVSRSGKRFETKDDHILITCPWHANGNESRPSRKINISNPRYKPLETYCWVCDDSKKRSTWNELAAVYALTPIRDGEEDDGDDGEEIGAGFFLSIPPPEDFYGVDDVSISHMPWKGAWRGIGGKLLKKLNATEVNSRDEPRLYLPVYVDGVEVGNVQCVEEAEHEEASRLKYILSGKWTQYTMYPVDLAFPMAEKLGYIVIVEGARDALNLLQYGVPSVCIWGTNGWTRAKLETLQELGVKIVNGMDGDDAGDTCRAKIESDCKRRDIPHAHLRFEPGQDPGKLTKTDVLEIAAMLSPTVFRLTRSDMAMLINTFHEIRAKTYAARKRRRDRRAGTHAIIRRDTDGKGTRADTRRGR